MRQIRNRSGGGSMAGNRSPPKRTDDTVLSINVPVARLMADATGTFVPPNHHRPISYGRDAHRCRGFSLQSWQDSRVLSS
jgi:hypothetical protein